MSYPLLLGLLGLLLCFMGFYGGGWEWLLWWLGGDFLVLAAAHAFGCHRVFGKRPDGTLPAWSRLIFLPLLVFTSAVWHLLRWSDREPASQTVTPQLVIGRRLLPGEVTGEFDNYVDLTAEFAEPALIRRLPGYRAFPILDGSAPKPGSLLAVIDGLRPGRTFIHCAQGHGRTALFALALLMRSGAVRSVEHGLQMLATARPGIRLSRLQRHCLDEFAGYVA